MGEREARERANSQQTTALHIKASSKKIFDKSFSKAKVRLFPSGRTKTKPESVSFRPVEPARLEMEERTDNQSQILVISRRPLVLDGLKTFTEELLGFVSGGFVDDDLSRKNKRSKVSEQFRSVQARRFEED